MKTAEEQAMELFGFKFIDGIGPEYKPLIGDSRLVEKIKQIQADALKTAEDICIEYIKFDAGAYYDSIKINKLRQQLEEKG